MQFDDTGPRQTRTDGEGRDKIGCYLKTMVTKVDLSELNVAMAELKGLTARHKWCVATVAVLAGIAFTVARLIH